MERSRGRTLVQSLRQELIQQLHALGFMPSAYSCESATPSCQLQRDLRASADTVAVSNDLHSCSHPQATLKIWHIRSLDYRPCQRSCQIQGLRVYNNLDTFHCMVQYSALTRAGIFITSLCIWPRTRCTTICSFRQDSSDLCSTSTSDTASTKFAPHTVNWDWK